MKCTTKKITLSLLGALFFSIGVSISQESVFAFGSDSTENKVPSPLFEIDKVKSTSSVSIIDSEGLRRTPASNITNTLYGLTPGLFVDQGDGAVGSDGAWMLIRGIGSYNYGNYAIYIDGSQTDSRFFQYLLPSEIETIAILKDAASLSALGVKGANGAIWVTTKRGVSSKPQVEINATVGVKQPSHITKPLGSVDYAVLYNEALSNDQDRQWTQYYTNNYIEAYRKNNLPNTDWYNSVLKDNSLAASTDISVKGGNENIRYFALVGHVNDNGFYKINNDDTHSNSKLELYNLRSNIDFRIFKFIEGKIDVGARIEKRRAPNYSESSLWNNLESYPNNIYYPQNNDGTWAGTPTYPDNPLASIQELGYISYHDRSLQSNLTLKENLDFITSGLYLSQAISLSSWTRGTYGVSKNYARYMDGIIQTDDASTNYTVWDDWGTNQWRSSQFTTQLGYEKKFNTNYLTSAIQYFQSVYNVDQNQNGVLGPNTVYAHQNISGRFHYSINQKYNVELSLAYSGSDNYMKGKRFGFYPAISGSWIISNESFMQSDLINFLKMRASFGKTGYDFYQDGRYLYQDYYTSFRTYYLGNSLPPVQQWGLEQLYTPNPNIGPEISYKTNVGVDLRLKDKFYFQVDGFIDNRKDIVTYNGSNPAVYGSRAMYENIGKVTTKGIELMAKYTDRVGGFGYYVGGNAMLLKDKIVYMGEVTHTSPYSMQTGNSIGTTFGYEAVGFYDITDFDSNGQLLSSLPTPTFGEVQPGDIKYKDISGDNIIDAKDRTRIGSPYLPKLTYAVDLGFDVAGFDMKVLFQGIVGRSVNLLNYWNKVIAFEGNSTLYKIAQDRWAYYPDQGIDTRANAKYPRLSLVNNTNNYIASTFWQVSGDYFKVKNIEVGYSLPTNILKNSGISKARIYFIAINPFLFSSFQKEFDMDPERPIGHPGSKSYNLGLSLKF